MGRKLELNAKTTGWPKDFYKKFKDFEHFKGWYDPKYKGEKAETIWKKIGGK